MVVVDCVVVGYIGIVVYDVYVGGDVVIDYLVGI